MATNEQDTNADQLSVFDFRLPRRADMEIFLQKENGRPLNLLAIGQSAFELEKVLRSQRVDRFVLPNLNSAVPESVAKAVSSSLADLMQLVFTEDVTFSFQPTSIGPEVAGVAAFPEADALTLFSGGVDSLCGILDAAGKYRRVLGIACGHADQSKAISLQRRFQDLLSDRCGISLRTVGVPAIGKGSFAHTRGFLYLLYAGAWAGLTGASVIVMSEIGPTMYQQRYGPFDEVTMTSHPYVVEIAQAVVSTVLERSITISTPFENMTKAEVMARCPARDLLRSTHSCITQRFEDQDGTCYGCVMRRLAAIAADVPDASYLHDPLSDDSVKQDNVLAILGFSLRYVASPERMELWQIENAEMFGKQDLFHRFALDNLAAVYKLQQGGHAVTSYVQSIVRSARSEIGDAVLEERLSSLLQLSSASTTTDRRVRRSNS